jgi:hypothetical protein
MQEFTFPQYAPEKKHPKVATQLLRDNQKKMFVISSSS